MFKIRVKPNVPNSENDDGTVYYEYFDNLFIQFDLDFTSTTYLAKQIWLFDSRLV